MEDTSKTKKELKGQYIEAVGRRKTSVARVRLYPSGTTVKEEDRNAETQKKNFVVNEKSLADYFALPLHHRLIIGPFEKAEMLGGFKVSVKVQGGGVASQAGAVRHGIARALVAFNEELRKKLKRFGYLTRDPRMVERKKYGLKKARRAPQWSKR